MAYPRWQDTFGIRRLGDHWHNVRLLVNVQYPDWARSLRALYSDRIV